MLEQNKKMDESKQCMEDLQKIVETGQANEDTQEEMCNIKKKYKRKSTRLH